MLNMCRCNWAVGLVGTVLGLGIMAAAAAFPLEITAEGPGAGFWPFLLGVALAVMGLALLFINYLDRYNQALKPVRLFGEANNRVYLMIGYIVVFCGLIHLVGFYMAGLLLVPAIMYLLGCRDKKRMGITAVCVIAFIYLVFGVLLNTTLPESIFLE